MRWPPDVVEDGEAACLSLPLQVVDEAFTHGGRVARGIIRDQACPRCPIATQCLTHAMAHGEFGIWGGTTQKTRTSHGAPSPRRAAS